MTPWRLARCLSFLADAANYFENRAVNIWIDDRELDAALEPALSGAERESALRGRCRAAFQFAGLISECVAELWFALQHCTVTLFLPKSALLFDEDCIE
jgi:hypothetical protein